MRCAHCTRAIAPFARVLDGGGPRVIPMFATEPGTVVTAIQGRDYARVYVKELERGKPSLALSPEEAEAVERAMAR